MPLNILLRNVTLVFFIFFLLVWQHVFLHHIPFILSFSAVSDFVPFVL